jgi:hypothetical protein
MSSSMRIRTDEQRARMNALFLRLRKGVQGWFLHDGLLHSPPPKEVVIAYVEAVTDHADPVAACARAWFGLEGLAIVAKVPDGLLARAARGWAWKLGEVAALGEADASLGKAA